MFCHRACGLTSRLLLGKRPAMREEAGRSGAVEALLAVLRGSSHEPALQVCLCPVLAAGLALATVLKDS